MGKPLKYTIFKTRWGYFGLSGTDSKLIKSLTPSRIFNQVKQRLLEDLPTARYSKRYLPELQKQITAYFDGTYVDFKVAIELDLSKFGNFEKAVLANCRNIRYGQTISYSDLARLTGFTKAFRAVANALSKNDFALIIPCHRVVLSSGRIGGYSGLGGVETKDKLLKLEQQTMENLARKM